MKIGLIAHFFNEELLIEEWINHHKKFFDYGVLINHHSTDRSLEIATKCLPANWQIVTSRLSDFNAYQNDLEVMDIESSMFPHDMWKMTLNITEFLFTSDIKEKLAKWSVVSPNAQAFGARSILLADKEDNLPILSPIWLNRNFGVFDQEGLNVRRWRYIHKAPHGNYALGRHATSLPHEHKENFLLLYFLYSPYPECKPRKLQIQTRIPQSDRMASLGKEHIVTSDELDNRRQDFLKFCYDLNERPEYVGHLEKMKSLF